MKKLLVMTMVLLSTVFVSCSKEDEVSSHTGIGSIYGIVTNIDSTEPIKGVGISLYKRLGGSRDFIKTMTTTIFDDGSYEFKDINFTYYGSASYVFLYIGIESEKHYLVGGDYRDNGYMGVEVENGKSKKIDLQVGEK